MDCLCREGSLVSCILTMIGLKLEVAKFLSFLLGRCFFFV